MREIIEKQLMIAQIRFAVSKTGWDSIKWGLYHDGLLFIGKFFGVVRE